VYRRTRLGTFVGRVSTVLPRTLDIGVLFRSTHAWTAHDDYGLRLFRGIQETLQEGQHRISLVTFSFELERHTEVPSVFLDHPPHGFILDERVTDDVVGELTATGKPVVVVNRRCCVPGAGSVFRDNRQGGADAARQILDCGHRVAACLYRDEWNGREAAEGFLEAMADAGAPVPSGRVAGVDCRAMSSEEIDGAQGRIMSSAPVPTAIFCSDDGLARIFYLWAQARGLRVPQDVSVVGTLDLQLARKLEPPLSTFRIDPESIGVAAANPLPARCLDPGRPPGARAIHERWAPRASLARVEALRKGGA